MMKNFIGGLHSIFSFLSIIPGIYLITQSFPVFILPFNNLLRIIELTLLILLFLYSIWKFSQPKLTLYLKSHSVMYHLLIIISILDFYFFVMIGMPLLFMTYILDLLYIKLRINIDVNSKETYDKNVNLSRIVMTIFFVIGLSISWLIAISHYINPQYLGTDILGWNLYYKYSLTVFSSIGSASICFIVTSILSIKPYDRDKIKFYPDKHILTIEVLSNKFYLFWTELLLISTLVLTFLSRLLNIIIKIVQASSISDIIFVEIPGLMVFILILISYYLLSFNIKSIKSKF